MAFNNEQNCKIHYAIKVLAYQTMKQLKRENRQRNVRLLIGILEKSAYSCMNYILEVLLIEYSITQPQYWQ